MATALMSRECGTACEEVSEFSLKFIITSLELTDEEETQGFKDILITTTFDGIVIKIEDFECNEDGEMKFIGRELSLQITPNKMSQKLHSSPVMFNLARACTELGTLKLVITDCFADAVKCEEFSTETVTNELKFVEGGVVNAKMNLIFQVSRASSGKMNNLFKGYAKQKNNSLKKSEDTKAENENYSSSFDDDSESNITCETDLCPIYDESEERPTTSFPLSSSSKTTRSKCCSDIATSLNVRDYSDQQKTYCEGCGGVSISGVTCVNKGVFHITGKTSISESSPCKSVTNESIKPGCRTPCKSSSLRSADSTLNCKTSIARICSECFEDLSVVPKDADCPKCSHNAKLQRRLISFKSDCEKGEETQKVRDCIKSIFEEIFLEAKDRLVTDWERLNRKSTKKDKKASPVKKQCNQRSSVDIKLKSMPRCSKVLKAVKQSRKKKSIGLRVKHAGVIHGHEICQGDSLLVPKNMGWLWNVKTVGMPAIRRGWRPGSVVKTVARIMKYYLSEPPLPSPKIAKEDPPTLRIQKKNGEYKIVMNPLQDEAKPVVSPIVFKLTKSEEAKKRSIAVKILKDSGIAKGCNCSSIQQCNCMNSCEKARLEFELTEMTRKFCLESDLNFIDLKESSDSEIDFEFTPPSAAKFKNPCMSCKPVKKSVAGTQCESQFLVEDLSKNIKTNSDDESGTNTNTNVSARNKKKYAKEMQNAPVRKWKNICGLKLKEKPVNSQCPSPQRLVCPNFYYAPATCYPNYYLSCMNEI